MDNRMSRSGYGYSYGFWMEDEIIPLYSLCLCVIKTDGLKSFLFEIRTNFKLKSRSTFDDDDGGNVGQILGSERFGAAVAEDQDEKWLEDQISFRLKDDYWMSVGEIQSLVRDAMNFARERAAVHPQQAVIPVVVGLDVWTVQRDGEPINAAIDRAIRPECLIPISMWPVAPKEGSSITSKQANLDHRHQSFFWELARTRVADEAGLATMDVCPVCSRNSVIGAQISELPCRHACHSRCVFQWLEKSSSCPSCGFPIPTDFEHLNSEFEPEI